MDWELVRICHSWFGRTAQNPDPTIDKTPCRVERVAFDLVESLPQFLSLMQQRAYLSISSKARSFVASEIIMHPVLRSSFPQCIPVTREGDLSPLKRSAGA